MAMNDKIEQWLASCRAGEMERLTKLEEEAAEAWLGSLSTEQRDVFLALLDGTHGLSRLRRKAWAAKREQRTGEKMYEPEGVGFR